MGQAGFRLGCISLMEEKGDLVGSGVWERGQEGQAEEVAGTF